MGQNHRGPALVCYWGTGINPGPPVIPGSEVPRANTKTLDPSPNPGPLHLGTPVLPGTETNSIFSFSTPYSRLEPLIQVQIAISGSGCPPIRYRGIGGNPGEPQYLEPGLKPRFFLRKIGSGAGVGQNHRGFTGPWSFLLTQYRYTTSWGLSIFAAK